MGLMSIQSDIAGSMKHTSGKFIPNVLAPLESMLQLLVFFLLLVHAEQR